MPEKQYSSKQNKNHGKHNTYNMAKQTSERSISDGSTKDKTPDTSFAPKLLSWFDQHGRKNLPWQHPITPYRVWLSEVMLQQTQVETVIPYFQRFLETFPTVQDLANAQQDEVLHLWTGLGYYARARNLHKCAQIVASEFGGEFPDDPEALNGLPGIGKSTAHAIASIAFGQQTAILDGNVKRVLTRYFAVPGWPGKPAVEKALWIKAEQLMPETRCADYTQAIMDLGATLCKRGGLNCNECPVEQECAAKAQGTQLEFPGKKPKKAIPTKTTVMSLIQNPDGDILLEQRPAQGIWGGLWSLPENEDVDTAIDAATLRFGQTVEAECWGEVTHVFSHYKLIITPVLISLKKTINKVEESDTKQWFNINGPKKLGLAAPVKKLLELQQQHFTDSLI